jgi:hypothetical protein
MSVDVNDQLDRLCFDHIENDDPVSEEDLTWLIDTVDRLTRWLERMPAHTYPEDSRLWKSWALTSPVLPMIRARAAARGGDAA